MSEFSRSRVTITLRRTGQVVKRDGSSFDDYRADSKPLSGRKRPIRERLGDNVDSFAHLNNKRFRRDGEAVNAVDDIHLSKDDLRHKIMRKNIFKKSRNTQHKGLDLRNVLSRPAQSSTNRPSTQGKTPEPREVRSQYSEYRDGRNYVPEPNGNRHLMPMTRSSSQHFPASRVRNARELYLAEARNDGRINYEPIDAPRRLPDITRSSMVSGIRPRSAERHFDSFSSRTLDHLRRKSPDEALTTSRAHFASMKDEGLQRRYSVGTSNGARKSVRMGKEAFDFSRPTSPSYLSKLTAPGSMRDEGLQRRYSVRGSDGARTSSHMAKESLEFSRPTSPSYFSKPAPPVGSTKTTAPLVSARPLPISRVQNSSYMNSTDVEVDDHPTVDIFLRSLDLEKYAITFKAEEVDMYSLRRMNDNDLKVLGIPMGPRKKIIMSLNTRVKRQG